MKHTSFIRLVKYDCGKGFRENRLKWVIAVFIIAFFTDGILKQSRLYLDESGLFVYMTEFFRGMPEYIPSETSVFELPGSWFLYYGFFFFLSGFYPVSDLYGCGMKTLLATENRTKWILSKYLWTALQAVCYFAAAYLILLLWSLIFGNFSTPAELCLGLYGTEPAALGPGRLLSTWFILPLTITIALSFLQLTIGIAVSTIAGYIVTLTILTVSCYWMKPWLPGNYLMLLRSSLLTEGGMQFLPGMLLGAGLILCSVTTGVLVFQRKDIF